MTRLNPRVDLAFKKIFGVEENKDLLISLINAIVSKSDEVEDITLLNPYNSQHFEHDKLSILDIKARGVTGKLFNIEMQILDEKDYTKRALYYWAKLYTEQLRKGDQYRQLNKAIGIHILNFISITNTDRYHNRFHIVEEKSGKRYFQDLELHTVELQKFDAHGVKEVDELVKKIHNALDMWVAFLTRHDLLKADHLPESLNQPNLNKALKVMDRLNLSDVERETYEAHLKWMWMEENALEKAKDQGLEEGLKKGLAQGFKKGRAEGREEGRAEGREEGRAEGIEATAQQLLAMGYEPQAVQQATQLPMARIQELMLEVKSLV